MERLKSLLVGLSSLAGGVLFVSLAVATVQQAPQYPLDDKLANEPAPWTNMATASFTSVRTEADRVRAVGVRQRVR